MWSNSLLAHCIDCYTLFLYRHKFYTGTIYFTRMAHIYNTQLWTVVQQTLDVIVSGIKVNVQRIHIWCIKYVQANQIVLVKFCRKWPMAKSGSLRYYLYGHMWLMQCMLQLCSLSLILEILNLISTTIFFIIK